ncbi:hypothetical protein [Cohnella sp. WQ 127256]|uniref:hypothetical protein n=1 Tax=Cohnella sp. WQ 127256 TaxID=2938790 RepID=UPI00211893F1|nr:hypothetical protein [Cohnella sp. WQ 127256]
MKTTYLMKMGEYILKENDYTRFVPTAPAGSMLSFLVLDDVLENNLMDLASDILDRYSFDNLNDKNYPIITAAARYGNKALF